MGCNNLVDIAKNIETLFVLIYIVIYIKSNDYITLKMLLT